MSEHDDRDDTDERESAHEEPESAPGEVTMPDEEATEVRGEEPADRGERRMRVVCSDGVTFGCGGYKAVDGGVVVFEDEERERTAAFVPYPKLEYILPVAVAERYAGTAAAGAQQPPVGQQQYQRQTVAHPPVTQRPPANQYQQTGGAPDSGRPQQPGSQQPYPPSR